MPEDVSREPESSVALDQILESFGKRQVDFPSFETLSESPASCCLEYETLDDDHHRHEVVARVNIKSKGSIDTLLKERSSNLGPRDLQVPSSSSWMTLLE